MAEQRRIVDLIANAIKDYSKANNGRHISRASIKLSRMSSVTPDVVRQCFQQASSRHGLKDIDIEVEIVPLLGECQRCESVVEIDRVLCCKSCGTVRVQIGDHNTLLIEGCEFVQ